MLLQEFMKKSLRYFYCDAHERKQSYNRSALERVASHNCNN